MQKKLSTDIIKKRYLQWALLPVVFITIGLGWKYPLLGYSVPVIMVTGMIGGVFRGRYVCGNLCPRGSFSDRLLSKFSYNKPIPEFFKGMTFRWVVFAGLMGFMTFQIANKPLEVYWASHIGKVFWFICTFTTGIAVVLGVFIHQRSWCSFCPIGTFQNVTGRDKYQMIINQTACKECRICEKVCTMGLEIVKFKNDGRMLNPDCLKCLECAGACPVKVLSFPYRARR